MLASDGSVFAGPASTTEVYTWDVMGAHNVSLAYDEAGRYNVSFWGTRAQQVTLAFRVNGVVVGATLNVTVVAATVSANASHALTPVPAWAAAGSTTLLGFALTDAYLNPVCGDTTAPPPLTVVCDGASGPVTSTWVAGECGHISFAVVAPLTVADPPVAIVCTADAWRGARWTLTHASGPPDLSQVSVTGTTVVGAGEEALLEVVVSDAFGNAISDLWRASPWAFEATAEGAVVDLSIHSFQGASFHFHVRLSALSAGSVLVRCLLDGVMVASQEVRFESPELLSDDALAWLSDPVASRPVCLAGDTVTIESHLANRGIGEGYSPVVDLVFSDALALLAGTLETTVGGARVDASRVACVLVASACVPHPHAQVDVCLPLAASMPRPVLCSVRLPIARVEHSGDPTSFSVSWSLNATWTGSLDYAVSAYFGAPTGGSRSPWHTATIGVRAWLVQASLDARAMLSGGCHPHHVEVRVDRAPSLAAAPRTWTVAVHNATAEARLTWSQSHAEITLAPSETTASASLPFVSLWASPTRDWQAVEVWIAIDGHPQRLAGSLHRALASITPERPATLLASDPLVWRTALTTSHHVTLAAVTASVTHGTAQHWRADASPAVVAGTAAPPGLVLDAHDTARLVFAADWSLGPCSTLVVELGARVSEAHRGSMRHVAHHDRLRCGVVWRSQGARVAGAGASTRVSGGALALSLAPAPLLAIGDRVTFAFSLALPSHDVWDLYWSLTAPFPLVDLADPGTSCRLDAPLAASVHSQRASLELTAPAPALSGTPTAGASSATLHCSAVIMDVYSADRAPLLLLSSVRENGVRQTRAAYLAVRQPVLRARTALLGVSRGAALAVGTPAATAAAWDIVFCDPHAPSPMPTRVALASGVLPSLEAGTRVAARAHAGDVLRVAQSIVNSGSGDAYRVRVDTALPPAAAACVAIPSAPCGRGWRVTDHTGAPLPFTVAGDNTHVTVGHVAAGSRAIVSWDVRIHDDVEAGAQCNVPAASAHVVSCFSGSANTTHSGCRTDAADAPALTALEIAAPDLTWSLAGATDEFVACETFNATATVTLYPGRTTDPSLTVDLARDGLELTVASVVWRTVSPAPPIAPTITIGPDRREAVVQWPTVTVPPTGPPLVLAVEVTVDVGRPPATADRLRRRLTTTLSTAGTMQRRTRRVFVTTPAPVVALDTAPATLGDAGDPLTLTVVLAPHARRDAHQLALVWRLPAAFVPAAPLPVHLPHLAAASGSHIVRVHGHLDASVAAQESLVFGVKATFATVDNRTHGCSGVGSGVERYETPETSIVRVLAGPTVSLAYGGSCAGAPPSHVVPGDRIDVEVTVVFPEGHTWHPHLYLSTQGGLAVTDATVLLPANSSLSGIAPLPALPPETGTLEWSIASAASLVNSPDNIVSVADALVVRLSSQVVSDGTATRPAALATLAYESPDARVTTIHVPFTELSLVEPRLVVSTELPTPPPLVQSGTALAIPVRIFHAAASTWRAHHLSLALSPNATGHLVCGNHSAAVHTWDTLGLEASLWCTWHTVVPITATIGGAYVPRGAIVLRYASRGDSPDCGTWAPRSYSHELALPSLPVAPLSKPRVAITTGCVRMRAGPASPLTATLAVNAPAGTLRNATARVVIAGALYHVASVGGGGAHVLATTHRDGGTQVDLAWPPALALSAADTLAIAVTLAPVRDTRDTEAVRPWALRGPLHAHAQITTATQLVTMDAPPLARGGAAMGLAVNAVRTARDRVAVELDVRPFWGVAEGEEAHVAAVEMAAPPGWVWHNASSGGGFALADDGTIAVHEPNQTMTITLAANDTAAACASCVADIAWVRVRYRERSPCGVATGLEHAHTVRDVRVTDRLPPGVVRGGHLWAAVSTLDRLPCGCERAPDAADTRAAIHEAACGSAPPGWLFTGCLHLAGGGRVSPVLDGACPGVAPSPLAVPACPAGAAWTLPAPDAFLLRCARPLPTPAASGHAVAPVWALGGRARVAAPGSGPVVLEASVDAASAASAGARITARVWTPLGREALRLTPSHGQARITACDGRDVCVVEISGVPLTVRAVALEVGLTPVVRAQGGRFAVTELVVVPARVDAVTDAAFSAVTASDHTVEGAWHAIGNGQVSPAPGGGVRLSLADSPESRGGVGALVGQDVALAAETRTLLLVAQLGDVEVADGYGPFFSLYLDAVTDDGGRLYGRHRTLDARDANGWVVATVEYPRAVSMVTAYALLRGRSGSAVFRSFSIYAVPSYCGAPHGGAAFGDPHLLGTDGELWDMHAAGDFALLSHPGAGRAHPVYAVHARFEGLADVPGVAISTGAGVRVGESALALARTQGHAWPQIAVRATASAAWEPVATPSGQWGPGETVPSTLDAGADWEVSVSVSGENALVLDVRARHTGGLGTRIAVHSSAWDVQFLTIAPQLSPFTDDGAMTGLLSATRDAVPLPAERSLCLAPTSAESVAVSGSAPVVEDSSADELAWAREVCEAHVASPGLVESCVYDVLSSGGDTSFATSLTVMDSLDFRVNATASGLAVAPAPLAYPAGATDARNWREFVMLTIGVAVIVVVAIAIVIAIIRGRTRGVAQNLEAGQVSEEAAESAAYRYNPKTDH